MQPPFLSFELVASPGLFLSSSSWLQAFVLLVLVLALVGSIAFPSSLLLLSSLLIVGGGMCGSMSLSSSSLFLFELLAVVAGCFGWVWSASGRFGLLPPLVAASLVLAAFGLPVGFVALDV